MARSYLLSLFLCLAVAWPVYGWMTTETLYSSGLAEGMIQIYPPSPEFYQSFFIVVAGQWVDSCVPVFDSLQSETGTLRLTATTPGPPTECQDRATDWQFTVQSPALLPNEYRLFVEIVSGSDGSRTFYGLADFVVQGGMSVSPSLPIGDEPFVVTTADLNPDACVPQYLSHKVSDAKLIIETEIVGDGCGTVVTPWQVEVSASPLPPGAYTAEFYITDQRANPPQRRLAYSRPIAIADSRFDTRLPWLTSAIGAYP